MQDDDNQSFKKEFNMGMTTSNILYNGRTYAATDQNKPQSQLSNKKNYFNRIESLQDQTQSILNDQAYFTNRMELNMFGHKLF